MFFGILALQTRHREIKSTFILFIIIFAPARQNTGSGLVYNSSSTSKLFQLFLQ